MEKFSGWNDESTGINPFVTHSKPVNRGWLACAGQSVLACILCLLRVPCLCILAGILMITSALSHVVGVSLANGSVGGLHAGLASFPQTPFPWLERIVRFMFEVPAARVAMTMFGYYAPKEVTLPLVHTELEPSPTLKARASGGRGLPGIEVYIVNCQSYIDVLWLASRFAPTFARVSAAGGLRRVTTVEALLMVTGCISQVHFQEGREASTLQTLEWARSTLAGPLVLFAEGAPTNGKGVLRFCPSATDLARALLRFPQDLAPHVRYLGIRYGAGDSPASFVHGSVVWHALLLMSRVVNDMTITSLQPGLDPQPLDCMAASGAGDAPQLSAVDSSEAHAAAAERWCALAQTTLASLLRHGVGAVQLDASDHATFVRFAEGDASAHKKKKAL